MDDRIFQNIYDELEKYLFFDWTKVVFCFEYGDGSYSFSFYVKNNGIYTKCYDIESLNEKELEESFEKIDKMLIKERNKLEKKWFIMTMIVERDGEMHTDFDYDYSNVDNYEQKKEWKKRYLI